MLIEWVLIWPSVLALLLVVFFAAEVFAGLTPVRKPKLSTPQTIAAVVPAHNEADVLTPTIDDLKKHMRPNDRILVVADNCSDDTAGVARVAGAECIERTDALRVGKGYALQAAIDHLKSAPPSVVYFIDADCRLDDGALMCVAGAASHAGRPAQGLTLMHAPENAPPATRVAEFAWLLMNCLRQGGLYRLFDVTRLTGTGMAAPWSLVADLDFASGDIVEDISLSVLMTERGSAPLFVRDAICRSVFPLSEGAGMKQRARWEQGSLRTARRRAVPIFFKGFARGDRRLMAIGLDLAIPPLTLAFAALALLCIVTSLFLIMGVSAPFAASVSAFVLFLFVIGAAWLSEGRRILPLSSAGDLLRYFRFKRKVYGDEARRSTTTWTRTERDAPPNDNSVL